MESPRVLVAGVGNIFLRDDGFGSEVARRLAREPPPDGVRVVDYGIGGVHLAYDLLDGVDLLVLVDAVARGDRPGAVTVAEITASNLGEASLDAHGMDPAAVLGTLRRLGGTLPRTLLVGCEAVAADQGMGLTPPVEAAVDVAVSTVRELLADALDRGGAAVGRR